MINLIVFGLKRKLWNQKFLVKTILVFLCVGLVVNIDTIINSFISENKMDIELSDGTEEYIDYFHDTKGIRFVEESTVQLVYEDEWKLYTDVEIPDAVINEIYELIDEIPGYSMKLANYELEIHHSKILDNSLELIVITMAYFLFISKSIFIVQEILEDKLCGIQKLYLTCMSTTSYVFSKIFEGWTQIIIENLLILLYGLIWLLLRFGVYFPSEFHSWLNSLIVLDYGYFRMDIVLYSIGILLVGIFILQYMIVLYMSKAKTIEEANHMTVWIHIFPIIIYYLCYGLYEMKASKSLIYIPFLQTLLLPMSLSLDGYFTLNTVIGCLFLLIFSVFIVLTTKKCLKMRMLNIE